MTTTRFLAIQEIIQIHRVQIIAFGGMHGIRDLTLLESAIYMPQAQFEGQMLHKNIFEQAAAYMYHITKNHPFFDGNKRTGAITSLVFLSSNGFEPILSNEDLFLISMQVAKSEISKEELSNFFKKMHQV